MADYNVNMKQWNGTSFDNVLPLAYNAKQLEGQSLADVKQWVQDNGLLLYTGSYMGTGTYGESHPTTLTFPFEPIIIFMPAYMTGDNRGWDIIQTNMVKESYGGFYNTFASGVCFIRSSTDRKTFSLCATDNANNQYNKAGQIYYFAAIGGYDMGGVVTEWLITSSGTWTVPRTGRYMIELYGGGGGAWNNPYNDLFSYQGGSSCQTYDSVMLTMGNKINVSIGVGGGYSNSTEPAPNPLDSTGTTFGSYSVAGGGRATGSSGGAAAGNKGTGGTVGGANIATNPSSGKFGNLYGYGGFGTIFAQTTQTNGSNGGPGAVYLKYLGA